MVHLFRKSSVFRKIAIEKRLKRRKSHLHSTTVGGSSLRSCEGQVATHDARATHMCVPRLVTYHTRGCRTEVLACWLAHSLTQSEREDGHRTLSRSGGMDTHPPPHPAAAAPSDRASDLQVAAPAPPDPCCPRARPGSTVRCPTAHREDARDDGHQLIRRLSLGSSRNS